MEYIRDIQKLNSTHLHSTPSEVMTEDVALRPQEGQVPLSLCPDLNSRDCASALLVTRAVKNGKLSAPDTSFTLVRSWGNKHFVPVCSPCRNRRARLARVTKPEAGNRAELIVSGP